MTIDDLEKELQNSYSAEYPFHSCEDTCNAFNKTCKTTASSILMFCDTLNITLENIRIIINRKERKILKMKFWTIGLGYHERRRLNVNIGRPFFD